MLRFRWWLTTPFSPDELQAMARCPCEAFTPAPSTDDLAAVQGRVTSIKFTALKLLASTGEEVTPGSATTASTMDEELRPRELAASALVEIERRIADAEARLTAIEAEADELRRLVVGLEVERADLCRQLELSERASAAEEPEAKAEGDAEAKW